MRQVSIPDFRTSCDDSAGGATRRSVARENQAVDRRRAGGHGSAGRGHTDSRSLPCAARAGRRNGGCRVSGGGYRALATDHEGEQIARWWNSLGVSVFVLKYRLGPKYHHPVELGDAQRALRWVRSPAGQYDIQADRIGIMGFSAGGHLASSAATLFDKGQAGAVDPIDWLSSRPDFAVLGYPVISMTTNYVHQGSKNYLLGENPNPALAERLSTELHVTPETPPVFLFHTNEDTAVPAENSVLFYLALCRAKIPAELHIYERGPHGVGLAWSDAVLSSWPARLADWMRIRGLLTSR